MRVGQGLGVDLCAADDEHLVGRTGERHGLGERVRRLDAGVAATSGSRVTTMVRRPGSTRPIDSNVLRPMTSAWPIVVALKWARSSGRCHGISPSRPMTPLRADRGDDRDARHRGLLQTAIGALMDGWAS